MLDLIVQLFSLHKKVTHRIYKNNIVYKSFNINKLSIFHIGYFNFVIKLKIRKNH